MSLGVNLCSVKRNSHPALPAWLICDLQLHARLVPFFRTHGVAVFRAGVRGHISEWNGLRKLSYSVLLQLEPTPKVVQQIEKRTECIAATAAAICIC